jgi:predicted MFS family arabinose efflux permease
MKLRMSRQVAEPRVGTVLLLASTVVFLETVFFTALAPLLPHYKDTLELSKLELGVFSAAYAAGAFVGAIPAGILALRLGVRASVIIGLGLLSLGSIFLGFAAEALSLDIARFVQGVGSSVAWTGALAWLVSVSPRQRRGEVLGVALGAAVGGSLVGPALGAAAVSIGAELTFSLIACFGVLVIIFALTIPPRSSGAPDITSMTRAFRSGEAMGGAYLLFFSAFLLGVLFVLAPLRLDGFGWSAGLIAACFVADSLITMLATPWLGLWSDRRGKAAPILAGLIASLAVSLGLYVAHRSVIYGLLVILAGFAYSITWVPGTAMLSDGAEREGVDVAVGFVLLNLAWTPGFLAGSVLGGSSATTSGSSLVYLILAALCAGTFVAALATTRARR